jgi:23S rRNA G2069 N7-methylase RlmK/C1962 C5-methylase RlmI
MARRPESGIDPSPQLVMAADARRQKGRRRHRTDAYRVLNGPADGAPPGLTLDAYGQWLVLAARSAVDEEVIRGWAEAARRALEPDGIVIKTLTEDPRESRSTVMGDRRPPLVMVREGEASFECRLDDGIQTGLFLDHRETRARAWDFSREVEVLNLFAYTCSFSVHAALAGARRVTSVDISQRALDWGRRNMSRSGVDPNLHRWFADDVLSHIRRARRSYGLVVLDPPVFGHGRKPFSLTRDLDELMAGAVEQLTDGGVLIASTHHQQIGAERLEASLSRAARASHGRIDVLDRLGLPEWDHPVWGAPNELDRGDYLTTVIARLHRS